jgi:hypothetical protein
MDSTDNFAQFYGSDAFLKIDVPHEMVYETWRAGDAKDFMAARAPQVGIYQEHPRARLR